MQTFLFKETGGAHPTTKFKVFPVESYTKDATSVRFKNTPVMPPLGTRARIRDREISGMEAHVCTDKAGMCTIHAKCWVLLCNDPRISINKSLGHFICKIPSFSRPPIRFQLAILEVLEEQF